MNWQPMETAPKDGVSILIFEAGRIYIASWIVLTPHGVRTERKGWAIAETEDWDYGSYTELQKPEAWHPLPEPPK